MRLRFSSPTSRDELASHYHPSRTEAGTAGSQRLTRPRPPPRSPHVPTVPQLARFLLTFAQKGQCGQRILKQATVDTMETVQREDLAVAMRSTHDLHATERAAHFGGLTVPPPGLQPSADCWIAASAAVKTAGSPSPTFQ